MPPHKKITYTPKLFKSFKSFKLFESFKLFKSFKLFQLFLFIATPVIAISVV